MHHLSKSRRQRNETRMSPEEEPEFQIAPMIDILLVLLVFFMSISSTEVLQSNKEVQLAVAADAKTAKANPGQVIINVVWAAINNSGSIAVNEKVYAQPADLIPMLQRQIEANPMCRVLVRADRNVRWEYLRSLLKAVGDAGIANVTFSVVNQDAPKT